MGTTTALLHCGKGHPYDNGLWGDFETLVLIEGDRCAWAKKTENPEACKPVWLADPQNILENGIMALSGASWEGFPKHLEWDDGAIQKALDGKKVVLSILDGSSLKKESSVALLKKLGVDFEVLG